MGRGINILVLAISLAFVATGIFILFKADNDEGRLAAVTVLLFFGGCALVGIAEFLDDGPPPYDLASGHVTLTPARTRPLVMGVAAAMWSVSGPVGLESNVFPTLLCWALLLFGGVGALVSLPIALNFRAKIEIDHDGFWDHRLTRERVLWSDVASITPERSGYSSRIVVALKNPAAHKATPPLLFWRVNLEPAIIRAFMPIEGVFWIADAIQHFAPPELLPPPALDDGPYEEWDDDDW
jgi:hypothetical protein